MSDHRLVLGDCLDELPKIFDKNIDLVLTDPPYGTTACKWDSVIPFEPMWKELKRVIKDNGCIALFGKEPFSSLLRCNNLQMFKYDWIWKKDTKSNFMQAANQPLNNIEIISIFSMGYARNFKDGNLLNNKKMIYNPQMVDNKTYKIPKKSKTSAIFKIKNKNGKYEHKFRDTSKRYPFNILDFKTDKTKLHPTQKPVALLEYLIKTYTNENDTVLDFTMGSGSTGVACKNLNRNFIGIEKDEKYFDIAKQRIEGVLI